MTDKHKGQTQDLLALSSFQSERSGINDCDKLVCMMISTANAVLCRIVYRPLGTFRHARVHEIIAVYLLIVSSSN